MNKQFSPEIEGFLTELENLNAREMRQFADNLTSSESMAELNDLLSGIPAKDRNTVMRSHSAMSGDLKKMAKVCERAEKVVARERTNPKKREQNELRLAQKAR